MDTVLNSITSTIKKSIFHITLLTFVPLSLFCQNWSFIKEKDGVRIYTRHEAGNKLKSFKGVTDIKVSTDKFVALLGDVNNTDWWDKNLTDKKVLLYEKNKRSQYYLVYKLPWPFRDRDLCVDVTTIRDQINEEFRITAVPLEGKIPLKKGKVRIKEYKQVWTVRPSGKGATHIELEFYVDPAESLPNWLINMLLTDSPVQSITGLRNQLEKQND